MRLDWTLDAENDLIDVSNYLQIKSSKAKADIIIEKIISKTELLEKFPQMGSIENNSLVEGMNLRYLIEGNYKILYRINPQKGTIEILSVFNTRQDPSKMLSKE
jgi:toxin ParE1/3/4